jgi:ribose transport system permease protein
MPKTEPQQTEPQMTDTAAPASAAPARPGTRSTGRLGELMRSVPGPLIGLVVIFVAMSFLSPYFLTVRNLVNIISQVSDIGIMAVGAAMVIIIGGIDLSVGSTLAFSMMTMAWLYKIQAWPFLVALLVGLLIGALVGLVNGLLSTYAQIQPFVATLATLSAGAGLALFITDGNPVTQFPEWFLLLTSTYILGFPLEGIILIAVYAIAAFWLRFRPSGRALYAVGGNEEVARLSGINVRALKVRVYVTAGLLAAVAGLIVTSRLDSAAPTAGTADLLNVIAVVVIGGASLSGGSGTMFSTFVGLLIIGTLNNGMALLNVSPNLQPVVIGAAIIIAVLLDRGGLKARGH